MNENEAKVSESGQVIIGDFRLGINWPKGLPMKLNEALLNEIAKRWNGYKELVRFLERAEYVFNCAILRTPTGEVRTECTNLNIERMQFINEAEGG